jgi:polyvinyl alcohol dehydrogenase (cytochrome)
MRIKVIFLFNYSVRHLLIIKSFYSVKLLASLLGVFFCHVSLAQESGEQIYNTRCAGCHDIPDSRAPAKAALEQMAVSRIIRTMDFGVMMSVTYMLDREQRQTVAEYLGADIEESKPLASAYCEDRSVYVENNPGTFWNGWSPELSNTRFQLNAGLTVDQIPELELKWAFAFSGDVNAFAPPTIIDEQMFVASAGGAIYAMNAKTGCLQWHYQADGPVRSAISVAPLSVPQGEVEHVLFFGDQSGSFYAVGAETGELLWRTRPESHEATKLTGSPVVHEGIVYVPVASWEESRPLNPDYECCTFRGSVVAYSVDDGSQLWKSFFVDPPPQETGFTASGIRTLGPSGAGTWSAPTVDTKTGLLYVTTGNNITGMTAYSDAVVALDLKTGEIAWSNQLTPGDEFNLYCRRLPEGCPGKDFDFGASAILEELDNGQRVLIAGQKSGIVFGLDPDQNGELIWQTRVGEGGINGGVIWGMASDGDNVYASVSDVGRIQATGRDAVDPRPSGVDPEQGGGLTAVRISDGVTVWYAEPSVCRPDQEICSPAQPAAVSAIPGVVFSGAVDGYLRAFSTVDGRVLWEFNTGRSFETVNGTPGQGGSFDGDGPVIVNGMVYATSGYGRNGGMPGNVLLAFGPPEE